MAQRKNMNKAIEQKVQFNGAKAKELFEYFLNPEKHSALHHGGAKTKISRKGG
jgi:hypothetical protein